MQGLLKVRNGVLDSFGLNMPNPELFGVRSLRPHDSQPLIPNPSRCLGVPGRVEGTGLGVENRIRQ